MHYNAQVSDKIKEFQDLSINSGNCFGDYEIINDIGRLCDVVTDEDCVFYVLKIAKMEINITEFLANIKSLNDSIIHIVLILRAFLRFLSFAVCSP